MHPTHIRNGMIGLPVVFVLTLFLPLAGAADTELRPNIVFILADDWGWGDLSCHGNKLVTTPNIDRLAREGTEFYQFNVGSPVCSPSRSGASSTRTSARPHWSATARLAAWPRGAATYRGPPRPSGR